VTLRTAVPPRVGLIEPGAVAYLVTRPRHVAVNEISIRPADQHQ
jgi:NADP-dependent 3-hydroxy acid dehydrogenase YdfG